MPFDNTLEGGAMEYLMLIGKCFFFYLVIITALRIMGKREVGELGIFDIVIYLVMSELLAISLTEAESSVFMTLVPLVTLSALQIFLSKMILHHQTFRNLVDGSPVLLVQNGIVDQVAMRKERYNIDDLLLQIRSFQIASLEEIAFAILENNGRLSVILKTDCKVNNPFPLIQDGIVNHAICQMSGVTQEKLQMIIQNHGIEHIKDVFLCMDQKNGFFVLRKTAITPTKKTKRAKRA